MMKTLNRPAAALFVCAALTAAAAQSLPRIDRESDARPRELISEGFGVGRIYVGRSTAADVASVYGKTFETLDYGTQVTEMRYSSLGLSFYYCRADERKAINRIEARAPFNAFTGRGIVLGQSNAGDVLKAYGAVEPAAGGAGSAPVLRYPGVEFAVQNKPGKSGPVATGAKVTAIDVVTARAGSECGAPAAK